MVDMYLEGRMWIRHDFAAHLVEPMERRQSVENLKEKIFSAQSVEC